MHFSNKHQNIHSYVKKDTDNKSSTQLRSNNNIYPEITTGSDIVVIAPKSHELRYLIDRLASYVFDNGPEFEYIIAEREKFNNDYDFITNVKLHEHIYYLGDCILYQMATLL